MKGEVSVSIPQLATVSELATQVISTFLLVIQYDPLYTWKYSSNNIVLAVYTQFPFTADANREMCVSERQAGYPGGGVDLLSYSQHSVQQTAAVEEW